MRVLEQEQLNPCTVRLTIEVETEQVQAAVEGARRHYAKQLRIPGFRPGKAPVSFVDQIVPKDDLYRFAAEQVLPKAYREAVEEIGLQPYGAPSIELDVFEEGIPCRFTAKVPLEPVVRLGEYKGLSAQRPDPAVSAEEIEREVTELRRRRAKQIPLDRPAQSGDLAVLDITSLEDERTKRFMLLVGQTFGQLDQLLVGMSKGEEKFASLTFPNDFEEASEWAGKLLECRIRLEALSMVEMPEANDELARELGWESLEELRQAIEGRLFALRSSYAEELVTEQLLTGLLEASTVEIPDSMWEGAYEERLREIEEEERKRGSSLEGLAASQNLSPEELRERIAEEAKVQVKRALLVRDIAKAENVELTQEDLDEQIQRLAERAGVSFERARKEILRQDGMDEVRFRALFKKVVTLLKDHAHIVTVAG